MSVTIIVTNIIREGSGVRVFATLADSVTGAQVERARVCGLEGDYRIIVQGIKDTLIAEAKTLMALDEQAERIITNITGWTKVVT